MHYDGKARVRTHWVQARSVGESSWETLATSRNMSYFKRRKWFQLLPHIFYFISCCIKCNVNCLVQEIIKIRPGKFYILFNLVNSINIYFNFTDQRTSFRVSSVHWGRATNSQTHYFLRVTLLSRRTISNS